MASCTAPGRRMPATARSRPTRAGARCLSSAPGYAEVLCATSPRHLPAWLGRMLGGPYAEYLMTKMPGASNEHARAELGWRPLRPSWRIGFREDLAAAG